jgi:hypothetical protein
MRLTVYRVAAGVALRLDVVDADRLADLHALGIPAVITGFLADRSRLRSPHHRSGQEYSELIHPFYEYRNIQEKTN